MAPGTEHHQTVHPLRLVDGELQRHLPAHRVPDVMRAFDAGLGHERVHHPGVEAEPSLFDRHLLALAELRHVDQHGAEAFGERADIAPEVALAVRAGARAVEADDRVALAHLLVVHPHTGRGHELAVGQVSAWCHGPFSLRWSPMILRRTDRARSARRPSTGQADRRPPSAAGLPRAHRRETRSAHARHSRRRGFPPR